MEHLITPTQLSKLGRPIGKVDDAQLEAFITEAEQMYVRPIIGDKLYLELIGLISEAEQAPEAEEKLMKYAVLLDGGVYEDSEGDKRMLVGLRQAISYLVYAQNIMAGSYQSTRFGIVIKDNDYSHPVSDKERSDAYNNALEVGNRYLRECSAYCKEQGFVENVKRAYAAGSIRIRKIGK